jgi:hypothetical protein
MNVEGDIFGSSPQFEALKEKVIEKEANITKINQKFLDQ